MRSFFDELGTFLPFITLFTATAIPLSLTPGFSWKSVVSLRRFSGYLPETIA
jgi:hypothetical protein